MNKGNQEKTHGEFITIDEGEHRYAVPKKIWDQYWKNYHANGSIEVDPWNIPTYREFINSIKLSTKKFLVNEITELFMLLDIPLRENLYNLIKITILPSKEVSLEFPTWILAKELRTIAGTCKELFGFDYSVIKETKSSSNNKLFWILKADIVQVYEKLYFCKENKRSTAMEHALINRLHTIKREPANPFKDTIFQDKSPEFLDEELTPACFQDALSEMKDKIQAQRLHQEHEEAQTVIHKMQLRAKKLELHKFYSTFIEEIIHLDLITIRSYKTRLVQDLEYNEKQLKSICDEIELTENKIQHHLVIGEHLPLLEQRKSVLHAEFCFYKENLRLNTLMLDKIKTHSAILENQSIPAPTPKANDTAPKAKNINLFFKHISMPQMHPVTIHEAMPLRTVKDTFEESIQIPKGSLRYTLHGRILPDEGTVAEWNQQTSAQMQENSTIQYTLGLRGD